MTTIHNRIKERRLALKMSMEQLAEMAGYKSWQTVQQWENGRTAPNRNKLSRVAEALKTTVGYLQYGDSTTKAGLPERVKGQIVVPIFDVVASMGHGATQPDYEAVIDGISLTPSWVNRALPAITSPSNLAVISGHGDSMAPTFSDGDLLLVDRGVTGRPKSDVIYVFSWGEDLYIKRIQRQGPDGPLRIVSDNPLFQALTVENGRRDEIKILGRVVWAWNGRKL